MGGEDYAKARAACCSTDPTVTVWIDGFPYLPFYHVEETEESIVGIVEQMMEIRLCEKKNHDNDNIKDNTKVPVDTITAITKTTTTTTKKTVHRISGGTTNRLYRVDQYLVRLFGAPGLIDRDEETYYYTYLSRNQLAPYYYGRFANGRIEQWLDQMRTIRTEEMPKYAISIATAMARLHRTANRILEEQNHQHHYPIPSVWIQLDRWLHQAESLLANHHHHQDESGNEYRLDEIRTELILLQESMKQFPCTVGFCHNDVLAANVLITTNDRDNNNDDDRIGNTPPPPPPPTIQLIDFEYGGYNYCSFDIANHWNEYAGGPPNCTDPDYTKLPTLPQQRAFLDAYYSTTMTAASSSYDDDDDHHDNDDDDLSLLRWKEVQFFLLVNHLYWGLWAVVQAGTEGCEKYDYRRYAINRIRQYFLDKEQGDSSFG